MKKTYLFVNSSFYPNKGGVENSLRSMAEAIVEEGGKVCIVCNDRNQINGGCLSPTDVIFGANVYRYQYQPGIWQLQPALKLLQNLRNEYEFDGVICRSWQLLYALKLAGYQDVIYLAPAVFANQNSPSAVNKTNFKYRLIYLFKKTLEKVALKFFAKRIVVFSKTMESQLAQIVSPKQVCRVSPGVAHERFFPILELADKEELRKNLGLPNKILILCVGRLEKVKGFHYAIECMEYLPSQYHLVLLGQGSQGDVLLEHTKKKGLQEKVTFLPFSDTPEKYYQASNLFLFTSTYEPFGQVLLEAGATGLVTIAFSSAIVDVDTATEEIFNEHPSLVRYASTKSAEELAQQIKNTCDHIAIPTRQFSADISSFTLNYSWKVCVRNILKALYER